MDYDIKEQLNMLFDEMSDDDIIALHNSIADDYNDENKIHYMDQFDEIIENWYNWTPSDVIRSLDANFSLDDEYFTVDDHHTIYSFTDLLDASSPWDRDGCINSIVEFEESYGNPDIQAILDQGDSEGDY